MAVGNRWHSVVVAWQREVWGGSLQTPDTLGRWEQRGSSAGMRALTRARATSTAAQGGE